MVSVKIPHQRRCGSHDQHRGFRRRYAATAPPPAYQPPAHGRGAARGRLVSARRRRRRHDEPSSISLICKIRSTRQRLRIRPRIDGRHRLLRRRHRLRVEQLAALRRHRRISRPRRRSMRSAVTRPAAQRRRSISRLPASPWCSSPMPMSISAPGAASRRSSAPASAARTTPIADLTDIGIGTSGAGFGRNSSIRGIRPGRSMPVSTTT